MSIIVKGYQLRTEEMVEERMEELYAVYPCGRIERCYKQFSYDFYVTWAAWEVVSEVPAEAHFIGNYPMPWKKKIVSIGE